MIRKADKRDFILVVQWRADIDLDVLENAAFKHLSDDNSALMNPSSDSRLTLYDCLNCFMLEETLSGNDKWYCNKCKDHVVATKKMEVYRTPEILIIHLKRFSHNRSTMFGTRKISDKIDFPIDGLNMSSYVLQNTHGKPVIYDLYAVSNHFGSLAGGHYTAFAKNPIFNKWY
jgi:ubiquitin carboxyl-terminal hydrolase 4/11/15